MKIFLWMKGEGDYKSAGWRINESLAIISCQFFERLLPIPGNQGAISKFRI
jgi:hypothetical protein